MALAVQEVEGQQVVGYGGEESSDGLVLGQIDAGAKASSNLPAHEMVRTPTQPSSTATHKITDAFVEQPTANLWFTSGKRDALRTLLRKGTEKMFESAST